MANNLTNDAVAAREAGMSYGQFKTLHPHTEYAPPVKPLLNLPQRECKYCGNLFYVTHGSKKYCDKDCERQYNNKRTRERYWAKKNNEKERDKHD